MYTKEFIESILNYSQTNKISEKESAIHFGIEPKRFRYYKKKYGFKMNPIGKGAFTHRQKRIYNVNDSFFETPNMLNCYWSGFIAADGCIFETKYKQNKLSIGLSTKDFDHLNTFKNDIDFDGPIKNYCEKKIYNNEEKTFYSSTLDITSQKITDDLYKNFNITPRKSLTLLPPNISYPNLIDSFICGYIDGDGSIYISKSNTRDVQDSLVIFILGTYEMMCWIKERFTQILGKELGTIRKHNNSEKNTYSYRIVNAGAREIFKHFYNLNAPKLKRKWTDEIYDCCVNYKKRNPICRRKGVNIFDLEGNLIKHFDTLNEASEYTSVSVGRISDMCKMNDSKHQAKGYMFSRDDKMEKYEQSVYINKKYIK